MVGLSHVLHVAKPNGYFAGFRPSTRPTEAAALLQPLQIHLYV